MEIFVQLIPAFGSRATIRVWIEKKLRKTFENVDLENFLPEFNAEMETLVHELRTKPHMVEFEMLDEPNPLRRFIRHGTDPEMMVQPVPSNSSRFNPGVN